MHYDGTTDLLLESSSKTSTNSLLLEIKVGKYIHIVALKL